MNIYLDPNAQYQPTMTVSLRSWLISVLDWRSWAHSWRSSDISSFYMADMINDLDKSIKLL